MPSARACRVRPAAVNIRDHRAGARSRLGGVWRLRAAHKHAATQDSHARCLPAGGGSDGVRRLDLFQPMLLAGGKTSDARTRPPTLSSVERRVVPEPRHQERSCACSLGCTHARAAREPAGNAAFPCAATQYAKRRSFLPCLRRTCTLAGWVVLLFMRALRQSPHPRTLTTLNPRNAPNLITLHNACVVSAAGVHAIFPMDDPRDRW